MSSVGLLGEWSSIVIYGVSTMCDQSSVNELIDTETGDTCTLVSRSGLTTTSVPSNRHAEVNQLTNSFQQCVVIVCTSILLCERLLVVCTVCAIFTISGAKKCRCHNDNSLL